MRRIAAGAFTATILLVICAACYLTIFFSSQTSENFVALAHRAERSENLSRAAYYYEQALIYNPYSTSSRLKLAILSVNSDNSDIAEKILQNGIKVSPSNPVFYIELARLYMSQSRLNDSVEMLNTASSGYAGVRVGLQRPAVQGYFNIYGSDNAVHFKINTTPNTVYYYTLDGTSPNFGSHVYKHPIVIGREVGVVSVVAVCDNLPSPVRKFAVQPQYHAITADAAVAQ